MLRCGQAKASSKKLRKLSRDNFRKSTTIGPLSPRRVASAVIPCANNGPDDFRGIAKTSSDFMKLNSYLLRSTVVAALGGLLFGFDTAVIAGTTQALTEVYGLTHFTLGVTVSSALVGTIFGSMLAGIPGDKFGRRESLRVMAILYLISALGCAFAWSWSALVIF